MSALSAAPAVPTAEPNDALAAWLMDHSTFWFNLMGPDGVFNETGFPLPLDDLADLGRLVDLHAALAAEPQPAYLRSPSSRYTPPHLWESLLDTTDADLARLTLISDFYMLPFELLQKLRDEATLRERYRSVAGWFESAGDRWTLAFRYSLHMVNPKKPGMLYCTNADPVWLPAASADRQEGRLSVGLLMGWPLPPISRTEPTAEHHVAAAYSVAIRILLGQPVTREEVINSQVGAAMAGALGRTDLLEGRCCGSWNYELVLPAAAAFNQADVLTLWNMARPAVFGLRPAFCRDPVSILEVALNNGSTAVLDVLLREAPEAFSSRLVTSNVASRIWLTKHGF